MLYHLFNAQSSVEATFCKSVFDPSDLTSVQYYLQCRLNGDYVFDADNLLPVTQLL